MQESSEPASFTSWSRDKMSNVQQKMFLTLTDLQMEMDGGESSPSWCVCSRVPWGSFAGLSLFNACISSLLENIKSLRIMFADVHADWQLLRWWISRLTGREPSALFDKLGERKKRAFVICPVQGLTFRAEGSGSCGDPRPLSCRAATERPRGREKGV